MMPLLALAGFEQKWTFKSRRNASVRHRLYLSRRQGYAGGIGKEDRSMSREENVETRPQPQPRPVADRMEGRVAVRSSARLVPAGGASSRGPGRPSASAAPRGPCGPGRPTGNAAAAERRARAAERAREVEDSPRVLREKCRRLARALREAKHLVVYTGAGISTAADIPDYRGPNGVWTRLQRGETLGRVEVSLARPTYTHMALSALWARGTLKFVVSQNCDGLHVRAGLPRRALAELHGDMFAELCAACRRVYLRAFDTTERTARHAHGTRRLCHGCARELADSIVHFGERGRAAWPLNWAGALRHAAAADVILCLGSSLKVLRRYPRLWSMERAPAARPALYVVNLQWTPKDAVAALKINARCDAVMAELARRLRLRVPPYRPARDPLLAHATPLAAPERHTTRRPLLAAPDPPPLASASASDSDEELPLHQLAARLRRPAAAAPAPAGRPPPDLLHAFQVSLRSGEATILLRAEHAPAAPARPPTRRPLSDLRRFRMAKRPRSPDAAPLRPEANGHAPEEGDAGPPDAKAIKKEEDEKSDDDKNGKGLGDSTLRRLAVYEPPGALKREPGAVGFKTETEAGDGATGGGRGEETDSSSASSLSAVEATRSLAAAIFRRAVLLCRASLYSGLHTILAPAPVPAPAGPRVVPLYAPVPAPARAPAAAAPGAECAWCERHYASRRCLWYPPSLRPAAARPWRRVGGHSYLCACCGEGGAGGGGGASPPRDAASDDGGWYGKGYRKGRRRRR